MILDLISLGASLASCAFVLFMTTRLRDELETVRSTTQADCSVALACNGDNTADIIKLQAWAVEAENRFAKSRGKRAAKAAQEEETTPDTLRPEELAQQGVGQA